jgi:phosphatidylglycerol:prolipoprotein diacylglycerol transferase
MHPVVFQIGKLVIHSYGLMLALSFLLGIWYSGWRAKKRGLDPLIISDIGFWLILAAIIGSRLYYVALHFEEFRNDLAAIFNPFHGGSLGIGGLVMYGGLIGTLCASLIFFKIKKLPFLPYADVCAPAFGFGYFLTRIGCFLNGCCYGKPATHGFGIHFPPNSPAGSYQVHLHADKLIPSQLYLSLGGLIIALIVIAAGRKKIFAGFEFYLTIVLYSILRFSVDFTRYYAPDEKLASLSHNQIVCIAVFVVFLGLIVKNIVFTGETENTLSRGQE